MKNLVDLFVAKDRTAVFWFVMACASIVCSAIYTRTVIADVRTKPQYVIMDGNGIYYKAPSVEFAQAEALHLAQSRLAMETIYTRTPRNVVFDERVPRLFYASAKDGFYKEITTEAKKFEEEERSQTVEVTSVEVMPGYPKSVAVVRAKGIITRHSIFKGKEKTEQFTVNNQFVWILNPNMETNGGFPTLCYQMLLSDPKKVEAEEATKS
jgi:hypothetical protein